jgi:hypothetical protein
MDRRGICDSWLDGGFYTPFTSSHGLSWKMTGCYVVARTLLIVSQICDHVRRQMLNWPGGATSLFRTTQHSACSMTTSTRLN